jgi:nitrate reductase alpha subunit
MRSARTLKSIRCPVNFDASASGESSSCAQLNLNPLHVKARADAAGMTPQEYTVQALKSGDIRFLPLSGCSQAKRISPDFNA